MMMNDDDAYGDNVGGDKKIWPPALRHNPGEDPSLLLRFLTPAHRHHRYHHCHHWLHHFYHHHPHHHCHCRHHHHHHHHHHNRHYCTIVINDFIIFIISITVSMAKQTAMSFRHQHINNHHLHNLCPTNHHLFVTIVIIVSIFIMFNGLYQCVIIFRLVDKVLDDHFCPNLKLKVKVDPKI